MANPELNRLIVELGCGSKPFSTRVAHGRRILGPNERYIGVDNFGDSQRKLEDAKLLVSLYEQTNGLPPQRSIQYGNADALPFDDREVDEIIAVNFFGDHRTKLIHRDIAHEIARVLSRSGRLTVVETYTPDRIKPPDLRKLLGRYSLQQTNNGSEYSPNDIAQYADPPQSTRYGAYCAHFEFGRGEPKAGQERSAGVALGAAGGAPSTNIGEINDQLYGIYRTLSAATSAAREAWQQTSQSSRAVSELAASSTDSTAIASLSSTLENAASLLLRAGGYTLDAGASLSQYAQNMCGEMTWHSTAE